MILTATRGIFIIAQKQHKKGPAVAGPDLLCEGEEERRVITCFYYRGFI